MAAAADVSYQAPYHHFPSKEALGAAIAAASFDDLSDAMKRARSLAGIGRGYVAFAMKHSGELRLMFGPALVHKKKYPDLARASAACFGVLLDAVGKAIPRASTEKRYEAALASWSLSHGLSTLAIDGAIEKKNLEQLAERLSAIVVRGL